MSANGVSADIVTLDFVVAAKNQAYGSPKAGNEITRRSHRSANHVAVAVNAHTYCAAAGPETGHAGAGHISADVVAFNKRVARKGIWVAGYRDSIVEASSIDDYASHGTVRSIYYKDPVSIPLQLNPIRSAINGDGFFDREVCEHLNRSD